LSYPTLPFALAYFLAQTTPERAALRKGPRHIGLFFQKDKSCRSLRFEVDRDEQFDSVDAEIARHLSENAVDTVTITYPVQGEEMVDVGIILERGKEPMAIEWRWGPRFGISLIENAETVEQIKNNVGVALATRLLNQKS